MKVLILAAGYGTRLYPLIKDTAKPLLPVADKPLINHVLDKVRDLNGLREVLVVTNNKFYSHFLNWAGKNNDFPVGIKIINDGTNSPDDRLGSVGDIDFVLRKYPVEDDLLVIGGDNLFDYGLEEYVEFAREKSPHVSIGLYDIGNTEEAKEFGVVEIDSGGHVISFEEKPASPRSSLIAMCFYYFPRESLNLFADYLGQSGKTDKAGDYIQWLSKVGQVYGFTFQGKWYDIGSIETYKKVQDEFKN